MENYILIDTRNNATLGRYISYRMAFEVRTELVRLHPAAADWAEIRREATDAPGPLPSAA